MNKKDMVDILNDDDQFKKILSAAKDDKEMRIAKYMSENLLVTVLSSIIPMAEEIKKDPEGFKNKIEEFEASILTDEGPAGK